jgi:exodeoxyribonuclease VII large subunit
VEAALRAASPVARVTDDRRRLEAARRALRGAADAKLVTARHRLGLSAGRLDSLSPLAVLGRGYSLTRLPSGEIVRQAGQVIPGADVRVCCPRGLDCNGGIGSAMSDLRLNQLSLEQS